MARITVEDCIDKFPSRFELVLVASNRARKLHSGEEPTVEKDNDKNTVIALREIADETLTIENLKDSLIEEHQTVHLSDEEDSIDDDLDKDTQEIENQSEENKLEAGNLEQESEQLDQSDTEVESQPNAEVDTESDSELVEQSSTEVVSKPDKEIELQSDNPEQNNLTDQNSAEEINTETEIKDMNNEGENLD